MDASNDNDASLVDLKSFFTLFFNKIQKKEESCVFLHPPITEIEVEGDHDKVVYVIEVVVCEHVSTPVCLKNV